MSAILSTFLWIAVMGQDEPQPAEVEWLREHAVRLGGVEAEQGFEDLEPLRGVIGDARVVALGESTHGSREQFQMKHRLVEFLATEMGFNTFSIEASMPESYRVDEFVSHGEGDPVELIRGMYFWTWSTEEVLAMVEWMRGFNDRHAPEKSIRFTGFDMQTPDVAVQSVVEQLERFDPDLSEAVRGRYAAITASARPQQDWTSATATLDPSLVAGKKILFKAQLRSQGADHVALWFRADRERSSVAFMNTRGQHREGDGWVEHRIELDIPSDIDNVNFGLIHSGAGSAWFDDLALSVDGEAPLELANFDFGMEEDGRGFMVVGADYRGQVDTEVAAAGRASFRIDRVASSSDSTQEAAMDADEAREEARRLYEEMSALSAEMVPEIGQEAASWTVQMARVVAQGMDARINGGAARDRAMADNVLWILEQDPQAKVILWAHNGHVANDTIWMGKHLETSLEEDYVPIGFLTSRGEYRAVANDGERQLKDHELQPAPRGSIESFFEAAELDIALLDLRQAESESSGWLTEQRPMRSIGAMEMDQQFFPARAFPKFEVLVYTKDTSGAWPLRARWSDAPQAPHPSQPPHPGGDD